MTALDLNSEPPDGAFVWSSTGSFRPGGDADAVYLRADKYKSPDGLAGAGQWYAVGSVGADRQPWSWTELTESAERYGHELVRLYREGER
jgi:hypothetical protein